MAIVLKKAPPAGRGIVGRALRDLRGTVAEDALLGGATLELSEPLPVYRLALDDIAGADSLARAELVGWRYLLEGSDGEKAGFADLKQSAEGEPPRFASLSRSSVAARLMQAASRVQELAPTLPGHYEARILEAPALNVSALWLAGAEDLFIPYLDSRASRDAPDVEPAFMSLLASRALRLKEAMRAESPDSAAESAS